jgi:hypothetical protein
MRDRALLLLLASPLAGQDPGTLDRGQFEQLRATVIPDRLEPWQTIPWRTDLEAARMEAAERRLPLFLWTMNGHPLGCT